jgi:hypothetical protein
LELPKSVSHALEIDRRSGTDFWRKAIEKEIRNVFPAFEMMDDGSAVPSRTKHINGRMHHFRGAVASGKIKIESIDTTNQLADVGTKPLAKDLFTRLQKEIMGW